MSEAFRIIRRGHREDAVYRKDRRAAVWSKRLEAWEQLNHGITQAALAAWFELRIGFKEEGVVEVGGVNDFTMTDGVHVFEEQAFYVKTASGAVVYLTGCSWGYGGEGPHGTAVVLADIGLYPTVEEALKFVAGLPKDEEWRREVAT